MSHPREERPSARSGGPGRPSGGEAATGLETRSISFLRLLAWQVRLAWASISRGGRGRRWQNALFVFVGLLWLASIWVSVQALMVEALRRSPEATWFPELILYSAWLGSLAMSLFFNVGFLLHLLFFSGDLNRLMAAPVAPGRLLAVRFLRAMGANFILSLFLSLPTLMAVGMEAGAPPAYYLLFLLVFPAFLALPVAITYLVGIPLARWVPTRRLRSAFTVAGFLFGVFLWAIPSMVPLRVTTPDQWRGLLARAEEIHRLFSSPEGLIIPSTWAARPLALALHGRIGAAWLGVLALNGATAILVAAAIGLSARSYLAGWIRMVPVGATTPVRSEKFTFLLRLLPQAWRPLFWKDLSVLSRDFRVSFQLYSLGILMCLLPFVSLMHRTSPVPPEMMPLVAVAGAIGATVVVSSQAGMMAVPLEGRAGFRLLAGPLSPLEVATSKWLVSVLLTLPIVAAQVLIIHAGFQRPLTEALSGGLLSLAATLIGSGFGVGMGAAFANFDWDHPKRMVRTGAQIGWGFGVGAIALGLTLFLQLGTVAGDYFLPGLIRPLLPFIALAAGGGAAFVGVGFAARSLARLEWA